MKKIDSQEGKHLHAKKIGNWEIDLKYHDDVVTKKSFFHVA